MNENVIRAAYNNDTITVYQAFNERIATLAINNQTFVSPPFKKERMTWIKPSFLWMMYRAGWGTKENQEHILYARPEFGKNPALILLYHRAPTAWPTFPHTFASFHPFENLRKPA
jgi:hypothetical protein